MIPMVCESSSGCALSKNRYPHHACLLGAKLIRYSSFRWTFCAAESGLLLLDLDLRPSATLK
jgi:hypothetical protein